MTDYFTEAIELLHYIQNALIACKPQSTDPKGIDNVIGWMDDLEQCILMLENKK